MEQEMEEEGGQVTSHLSHTTDWRLRRESEERRGEELVMTLLISWLHLWL